VPLTAIRGLGTEAVQYILAMRAAIGQFTSLLDFCQRVERTIVDGRNVLVLVKLGAFSFTGLPRTQLALAERVYLSMQRYVEMEGEVRQSDGGNQDTDYSRIINGVAQRTQRIEAGTSA
jgi:DNA polymerase-3 subunit alpha